MREPLVRAPYSCLTLTSLQSHEINRTSNAGGGFQVEGGFSTSWNASANAHASSGKGERHQVLEQAGLYAENAYHIEADNVHLEGAAIASNNAKASELNTNKLTFNDIENRSSSYAASAGVSVGTKEKEDESNPQYNQGLPQYEAQNDRTFTKATLTEGNITLNKDSSPIKTTAAALGINTDITKANSQTESPKDINKQLDEQQQIATAAGHVKSAVETFVKNQRKEAEIKLAQEQAAYEAEKAKARAEGKEPPKKSTALETAEQNVKDWGTGGSTKRAIDALTNAGLIALSGGSAQSIATAATSPYVNQLIKKATEDYPALNIPTHILWGAVEAELMGGNAQTGAISTAAGELGAKYLTEHLYQKDEKDLTETERSQIKEMAKALAGVAGGLSAAGQGSSAVKMLRESSIGTTVANNAVENNSLADDIHPSIERKQNIEMYAKVYFNGDEDKAAEFIEGLEIAEARGQIDTVKESVETVKAIASMKFDDFLEATLNAVQNTDKVVESVVISLNEWDALYAKALKENPRLAGEMLGYRQGNLKGIPTGGVVLTGSSLVLAKSMVELKKVGANAAGFATHQVRRVINHTTLNKVINEVDNVAVSTDKGFINATKVCAASCEIKATSKAEQLLIDDIVKNGDIKGSKTETLINDLAKRSGYEPLNGGKYGSNNGFDHVLLGKDGSVIIIDSKQIKNSGSIQVSSKAAGNTNQLSDDWIKTVISNLPKNDPARIAIRNAERNGKSVKTIIAGVDKSDGKVVLLPVKIPNKN